MTEAGFIVITGDVGAGKTTIVRHYLKHLRPDVTVGVINNANPSIGNLMGWITAAFEIDRKGRDDVALYDAFMAFVATQYGLGKRTVLIIDEAQNLTRDILEELRMLSNVNYGKDLLLQIILVGQPELLDTLKRDDMQQFRQRIAVHCHLAPLSAQETAGYIEHRLSVVDGTLDIFREEALAAVHYYTGGVPRLINLLCDQALTYGFSEDQEVVTAKIVAEVVADRAGTGLSPFLNSEQGWTMATRLPEVKLIRKEIAAMSLDLQKS